MNVNEVTVGLRYRVSGDLSNGRHSDGTPRISHDDVVRAFIDKGYSVEYRSEIAVGRYVIIRG